MPHSDQPISANLNEPNTVSLPVAVAAADAPASGGAPQSPGDTIRDVRWNLGALMLDVTCFSLGMAFMDQSAVLPLLLQRLGASGPLIGGFAAARSLVFSLLQIFVAYVTHGRVRQKPWLTLDAAVGDVG